MNRILKYPIPTKNGFNDPETEFTLELPKGSSLLSAQEQYGSLQMWFEVTDSKEIEKLTYCIFGTGEYMPEEQIYLYINTIQTHEGRLVWHLYEKFTDLLNPAQSSPVTEAADVG